MSNGRTISLSTLWFSYDGRDRHVLRDLSLEIPAGTPTAILGPNGSGKTTLLRLLLGVLHPSQGTILLDGQPLTSYSRREMSQLIGLVPQSDHIPFDFSVLEYVLLGRAPYLGPLQMPGEIDRQVALAALRTTDIEHLKDRPVPYLSGGEQQLVKLARALAQTPRILLLDEPTAHLDLGNQTMILQMLRRLVLAGTTLVLTTHDPNAAAAVARFVVLMRQGQILAAGPVDEMLSSEHLCATYGVPVHVATIGDRRAILFG